MPPCPVLGPGSAWGAVPLCGAAAAGQPCWLDRRRGHGEGFYCGGAVVASQPSRDPVPPSRRALRFGAGEGDARSVVSVPRGDRDGP